MQFKNQLKHKQIVFFIEQDFPESGDSAYYYVQVDEPKVGKFLKLMNGKSQEPFDLNDFGSIIESGYGEPPLSLSQKMEDLFQLEYAANV